MVSDITLYFTSGSVTRFWQPKTSVSCLLITVYGHYLASDYESDDYLTDDGTVTDIEGKILHGSVEAISETLSLKYSANFVPTADKDIIQKLGKNNRTFKIKGILTNYKYGFCYNEGDSCNDMDSGFFRDMIGYTGSIFFANSFSDSNILTGGRQTAYSDSPTVLWTGVDFEDNASRPMERKFSVTAVEL